MLDSMTIHEFLNRDTNVLISGSQRGKTRYVDKTRGPLPLVLLVCGAVFCSETLITALLRRFGIDVPIVEAVIDSSVLLALISPALYFWVYKPMQMQIQRVQYSENQVRQLSRRLLEAAEDEQRRLALDLHDELGQSLSAMQLQLEQIQKPLHTQAPQLENHIQSIQRYLRQLQGQVRTIVGRLRPTLLDDLGIGPALESLVADLATTHPEVQLRLNITGLHRRPSSAVETAIFRLCQEGLNNAIRHGRPRLIEIKLTASHPELILTIHDDGCGFDAQASRSAFHHLGLLGMRERVSSLGGHFHLQSVLGKGTRIRILLPYEIAGHEPDSHSDR